MTEQALDSASAPSDPQIAAAKAAGYVAWFGYFKLVTNDGIYNGWADSDFERVLAGGLGTGAYCSGWDDPLAVKARAARLGIRIRLDVEGGIRPDGPWVQGWLDASGSGLYGNAPVFDGRRAADYVVAVFPISGDPGGESWPSWLPRPTGGPCGWQWAGTHDFAGISVDSTWLDNGFFTFSADSGVLSGPTSQEEDSVLFWKKSDNTYWIVDASGKRLQDVNEAEAFVRAATEKGLPTPYHVLWDESIVNAQLIPDAIRPVVATGATDLTPVLNAIANVQAHPAVVSDPALAAAVAQIESELKAGLKLDIPLGSFDIKGTVGA